MKGISVGLKIRFFILYLGKSFLDILGKIFRVKFNYYFMEMEMKTSGKYDLAPKDPGGLNGR